MLIPAVGEVWHELHESRVAEFHRLHASGCFVMPNPWDVGQREGARAAGLRGAGDDERRSRLDAGSRRRPGHPGRGAGASPRRRGRGAVPVNADFEGGYRGGAGGGRGERDARRRRRGSPGSRSRTRRATRRIRSSTSIWRWTHSGRPTGDRRERHRRRPHGPLGGLRLRAPRHRRDDPPAARVRRGWGGLPLRPAHREPRARRRDRGRGGAEAGEPADQCAVHDGRRGGARWGCGGSAWAARSPAPPGTGS